MRSDAVSVAARNVLTSIHGPNQVCYSNVCVVRDEAAAGSNPATTTSSEGMRLVPVWPVVFANHS
jgi:hypothetical protein